MTLDYLPFFFCNDTNFKGEIYIGFKIKEDHPNLGDALSHGVSHKTVSDVVQKSHEVKSEIPIP